MGGFDFGLVTDAPMSNHCLASAGAVRTRLVAKGRNQPSFLRLLAIKLPGLVDVACLPIFDPLPSYTPSAVCRRLHPPPHPRLVGAILIPELALQIALLARDDADIDHP
jgi:hypothetical protein